MAAQDATLARIRTLSIEYHFYNAATRAADEERLFARLRAAGFRCLERRGLVAHFDLYPRVAPREGWTRCALPAG